MKTTSSAARSAATRFDRRRERTRGQLLAAATRVLAEKGLHGTKIADIAAAADVGVGTFYLHFPDKETLFDAVVDETVRALKATVDAARAKAKGPLAQIRAANVAFFHFAQENREVFKIVFGHAAAYNDLIRRAQALFIADVERTVREGIACGVFAPLPPALVAQAVIGMATQVLSWWTEHESVPIDSLIETTTTLALGGIAPDAAKGASHG
ncbi:MAG TPA: TetR/AcrR family transcriptional regulator [Gaiellaceae bacterium]|nr:TetR/AcrR family transcriptional regulator [Gaiellaceae bacterium]